MNRGCCGHKTTFSLHILFDSGLAKIGFQPMVGIQLFMSSWAVLLPTSVESGVLHVTISRARWAGGDSTRHSSCNRSLEKYQYGGGSPSPITSCKNSYESLSTYLSGTFPNEELRKKRAFLKTALCVGHALNWG